ncbi:metal-dependent hydrolase [bacterium]|nr:metal-dependent hydrolase [bacterium]
MCSPVGHTLFGMILTGRKEQAVPGLGRNLPWIALFACLPDIDLLFGLFTNQVNTYHRQWTHSIGFVVMCGMFVLLWTNRRLKGRFQWRPALFCAVLVFSHLILDILARDGSPPYGIPLAWPFDGRYVYSPVVIFPALVKSQESRHFLGSVFSAHNAWSVLVEILLLGPILGIRMAAGRLKRK